MKTYPYLAVAIWAVAAALVLLYAHAKAITAIKQARSAPVQEPDLIDRLKHPEDHYEFTDPKKANAVLMSLCQEAADALAAPVQDNDAHYKGVVEGVQKLFDDKRAQPAPVPTNCRHCGGPVAWKWHQAPVKTLWGHDMVVADLAIDKDNTVSVYCERDQTAKVEAMFTPPAAQRQWVGLTDEEAEKCRRGTWQATYQAINALLREKNGGQA